MQASPNLPGGGQVEPERRLDREKLTHFYNRKSLEIVREGSLPEKLSLVSSVSVTLCGSKTKGGLFYLLSIYLPEGKTECLNKFTSLILFKNMFAS